MSLDPYASCPCGSGKKFKWCCQPIYGGIQHAWQLENSGQHEAALKTMEQVVQQHGGNPEAWGQMALLLASRERFDQAEEALEKAFALNPNYPFGLKLKAQLRFGEGEFQGALLLARKAADAYDPDAHDALAEVHGLIFDCEMRANRPVAARAALARAVHLAPGNEELRKGLENIFGPNGRFPDAARKTYEFKRPGQGLAGPRRQAWDRAFAGATARLPDVARTFEGLTKEDPADAAAWFNLGLTRAWLGDHPPALEALDRYVELEADESRAAEAAALAEVLRLGQGMEEQCDHHQYSFLLEIRNPQPVQALLQDWQTSRRLAGASTPQEGVFSSLLLELSPSGLVTAGRPAADVGRVAGFLVLVGNSFRFSSTVKDRYDRVKDEVRQKLSLGLTDLREVRNPPPFADLLTEAVVVPLGESDNAAMEKAITEHAGRFFEETWIHRPLKSLNSIAPVDAAGHAKLRKKLLGVILLLEQSARKSPVASYSFDGLRRKLGLAGAAGPAAGDGVGDIARMGAPELSALKPEALSEEQLEKAYQTAHRLDAQELAAHFAEALVSRPVQPGKADRYPWYSFLIQKALRDGEPDAAMDRVNEGEKVDCEHNEGRRRNDYEAFRAVVHTKRGEVEAAEDVYRRLIERVPRDFKARGKAAEAMLSLKQPAKALRFAEEGVAAARQANDRGSEEYLLELAAAARKQQG
jgi:tetratricopeptide (TPR) repeat protein